MLNGTIWEQINVMIMGLLLIIQYGKFFGNLRYQVKLKYSYGMHCMGLFLAILSLLIGASRCLDNA
jgi:hypothetical protein